jgi:hypothetical protein
MNDRSFAPGHMPQEPGVTTAGLAKWAGEPHSKVRLRTSKRTGASLLAPETVEFPNHDFQRWYLH